MTKEEMNDMFNKNINIAYKIANTYRINYPNEYEDIKQIALLGLWKAIKCYNPKWALSTIAYKTIYNNINYYLRQVKKHADHDFSLQTVFIPGEKSNDVTVEDLIEDESDLIEDMLLNIDIHAAMDSLNLSPTEEQFLELKKQGMSQREIGLEMNRSQAQISRIQTKLKKRFKNNLEGVKQSYTPHKPIKPTIKEEPKMIHELHVVENNKEKTEIEFFCPETPEENEEFGNRIDDMIERIRWMNYFNGIG